MVQNFCQCKQGLKHLTEGRCTHLFTPRFNMNGRKKLTVYFPLFRFFSAKKHVAAFQQQFHWFSPPALPYLPLISLAVLHELWGVWSHKNNIFEKLLSKTFWRKSIFTPSFLMWNSKGQIQSSCHVLQSCPHTSEKYVHRIPKGLEFFTYIYMTQFHCSW